MLTHLFSPCRILCTGANVGLIETLTDSMSIDAVKKQYGSLPQYFATLFGSEHSTAYQDARQNVIASMAASSVYCYLFQVKPQSESHETMLSVERAHAGCALFVL